MFLIGLILGYGFSALAYWAGALSLHGMIAAGLLGGVTFGLGGWRPSVVLIWFFLSSSLLTRLFAKEKTKASLDYAKGGARDLAQVLANGGAAGLAILVFGLGKFEVARYAFVGALAAANADTWATELGVLSRNLPRLLTSGKEVPRGTSGAVSRTGLLASLVGAATVAGLAGWLEGDLRLASAALVAGFLGSGLDSFLGACCQRVYYCPACRRETERHPQHHCGTTTEVLRGASWLDNDGVNALATVFGALLAGAFTLGCT